MRTFQDSLGREWQLSLSLHSARKLKNDLDIDIQDAVRPATGLMHRIHSNPFTLADVLWCLVADQAAERGVAAEDFFNGLTGDSLDVARELVTQEIIDLSPRGNRDAIRSWLEAAKAVDDGLVQRAIDDLNAIDIEAEVNRLMSPTTTQEA